MNTKTILLSILCVCFLATSYAQDKLYKKNGDMIQVNVTEITQRTVSYKKADNPDGPSYTINKADVAKITYPNGTEDFFGDGKIAAKKKNAKKYGNNILSIMPMQVTSNIGVGIAYERVIDKKAVLSFYLPVTAAFPGMTDPTTGGPTPAGGGPTIYVMPGLKFYPTGGKGVVRYSVGPNLTFISGKKYVNDFIYDNTGVNIIGQDIGWRQNTALGIMITNGININPLERIHMGLELGLGFTYLNQVNGRDAGVATLGQFGFKIGYRF